MAERPAKIGIDQILSYWDDVNETIPFFSIWWNSREKATQYSGDSLDEAREKLSKWLTVNDVPGDNTLYYLRIQSQSERAYKWNSEIIESIPFRFNTPPENYGMVGYAGGGNYQIMQAISGLGDKFTTSQKALEARIVALEDGPGEDDLFGKISGVLENPNIGPVIGQFLGQFMSKFTNTPYQQIQQPTIIPQRMAINGVPAPGNATLTEQELTEQYQQRVNAALIRLQSHCDLAETLTALANLAESNPDKFKMGLSFLN